MPVPSVRTITPENVRNFGRAGDTVEVPPLTDIQTHSYQRFLQLDVPPEKRNRLTMHVLGFPDLKSQLLDTLIAVANSANQRDGSNPSDVRGWMEREIEREYAQIKDAVAVAPPDLALYSKDQFEQEIVRLRDFVRRRSDLVKAEVAAAR